MPRLVFLALVLALACGCSRGAQSAADVAIAHPSGHDAETSIAVDPSDPDVLLAAFGSTFVGIDMYGSTDGGRSWVHAVPGMPDWAGDDACASGDPATAIARDGTQYVGYLLNRTCSSDRELERNVSIAVASRADAHTRWSDPVAVAISGFDDKPVLAVDAARGSAHEGRLYVAWTHIGPLEHTLLVAHSDDRGASWSKPVHAAPEGTTDSTYASLTVGPSGELYLAWSAFGTEVHVRRSTDGGETFEADHVVDRNYELPAPCDVNFRPVAAQQHRCVSANPTVSAARERVFVTYEGENGRRGQDVFVAAFDPTLARRLLPPRTRVSEHDAATDEFQPVSAVDPSSDRLWVCYYASDLPPHRARTRFTCTHSDDGARSWSTPEAVASEWSDATAAAAGDPFEYGDYQGLAAGGGRAHPIWTDFRDEPTGPDPYTADID